MSEHTPTTPRTTMHERPLSPHLTIYKPQITSVLSISHRITGAFLAAGLVVFVAWLWIAAYCPEGYGMFMHYATNCWGQALLAAWSFAFFYHLLNGVRHLFWDMGQGLDLPAATRSGWLVVVGSVVVTASIWYALLG